MKPRHQVSRAAIELIKRFEGFREKAAQLPDGRWTLGYGHTLTARDGAWVSERDAEALLMYDLIGVAQTVNDQVFTPLNQNQFDALCAFAFNIGLPAFKSSAVLMLINEGQLLQAACAMELWRKADFEGERIVVDALVRRRAAEKALFLTPPEGFVPAPTPMLAPHVDADGLGLVPAEAPAVIRASLDGETASLTREPSPPEPAETEAAPEVMAAALAQRLARIFPDKASEMAFPAEAEPSLPAPEPVVEPEAEPAEVVQPSVEAEAAAEENGNGMKAFVLSPPAVGEAEPEPEPEVEAPAAEPAAAPETLKATSAWRGKVLGLSALAALGAVLFGASVYWMFDGGPSPAGAPSTIVIGWVIGTAAVLLVGGAAYVLLDLLGRGDEALDALED
ncbi:lysozyme [Phenylobacterium terrae]|uniref:Lysozyme n=1 Tax=Phenylobacterium terrae TaxID=2665495 RepID=A0ABW4N3H2_9CAUL